ncbi:hypothetical protein E5S67_05455 [Microcoleus sp. IPMA8]|uniref:Uncharacterized protein n=1 Tax=Microcoleus asticus IPMA8 TaxID=2563858 RepID=A0ABX2D700_9CYAN|nr:hypothetical protein [Microcoleus asticus IPMA8]
MLSIASACRASAPSKYTQIIIQIVALNLAVAGMGAPRNQTDLERVYANFLFYSQV